VAVRSTLGAVTIARATAGDDIVLRAAGDITVTGVGGSGAPLQTTGASSGNASTTAAGDLMAQADPTGFGTATTVDTGADVDVRSDAGSITVAGPVASAGGARLQTGTPAGGSISVQDVTASNGDILLDGTTIPLSASSTFTASRDIAIRARTGAVILTSATAGDDLVIRAAGGVTASGTLTAGTGADSFGSGDNLAASDPILSYWATTPAPLTTTPGHDIDIRTPGAITLSGVTQTSGSGSDIRLDSGALVTVATLRETGGTGGEQVLVAATNLVVNGQINAPSADVLLFARETPLSGGGFATAVLGGPTGSTNPGFIFDNTEVSHTSANSLNLFSGVSPGASSNLAVQDLTYTASLRTVRTYAGPTARIDVTGQVTDPAGTNAVFVAGAAATDPNLAGFIQGGSATKVSLSWSPAVTRISGGIGASGNPFARTSLAGGSIYIAPTGDSALSGDFETVTQTTAPEVLAPYAGTAKVQVRTGVLELRASNQILERNLQTSSALTNGQGLVLGALLIDRLSSSGSVPSRVSLFGQIDGGLRGVLPTPSPSDLIGDIPAAFLLHFGPGTGASVAYSGGLINIGLYRFNTCEFGGGGCFDLPNPPSGAPDLPPIISFVGLPPVLSDPTQIGEVGDPFAPVEDEPVTNTGGEVEWLPPSTSERHK
jgi:hypothetical protein